MLYILLGCDMLRVDFTPWSKKVYYEINHEQQNNSEVYEMMQTHVVRPQWVNSPKH